MKLALVTPWFGRELKGGAEQQVWQIAARLAARGHAVEVLTTCCRSHQDDWSTNHWPEGLFREREGFHVRRFPVEPRDRAAFDRVCAELLSLKPDALRPGVAPVPAPDEETFVQELIKSPRLVEFIGRSKDTYEWMLFIPYLYGPVLDGLKVAAEKAALQPCLHDEAYAYLPRIAEAFYQARLLLFNSKGEMDLAAKLFGPAILLKSRVVGEGVETSAKPVREGTNENIGTTAKRYLLYLGRKDSGKNVDLLVRAFARFRAVRPNSTLELLIAGHGTLGASLPVGVSDLGLVSDDTKEELLEGCLALVQPSTNESYSRVIMEAWLHGKPVAVHANCPATAVAVHEASGGWTAYDESDWARWFVELDRAPAEELSRMGRNGCSYAQLMANWNLVIERYEAAFQQHDSTALRVTPDSFPQREINQFLPNLSYGDAISNFALCIRNSLRKLGFRSRIFVRYIDPRVADKCEVFTPDALQSSDAAIYHHSIGSVITQPLIDHSGPKCLIYHNITPAEFFQADRPEFAALLQQGRDDLPTLASHFPISCGVSHYNALELEQAGFTKPEVLPLAINPKEWNSSPDPVLMEQLQRGYTNLLFVGRITPNKDQIALVEAFCHYLVLDSRTRLHLVGTSEANDPYVARVREMIMTLGLEGFVTMPGNVSAAQLQAYYRTAHLFWSMSEHEGFGVPLVEAMWFDVPVFAFQSSAVAETLGEAALMFPDKTNFPAIAALAHLVVHDAQLKEAIVRKQRGRRVQFLPEQMETRLQRLARRLLSQQVFSAKQSKA